MWERKLAMKLNCIKLSHLCVFQNKMCSILWTKDPYTFQQFLFKWGNQCLKLFCIRPPTNICRVTDSLISNVRLPCKLLKGEQPYLWDRGEQVRRKLHRMDCLSPTLLCCQWDAGGTSSLLFDTWWTALWFRVMCLTAILITILVHLMQLDD